MLGGQSGDGLCAVVGEFVDRAGDLGESLLSARLSTLSRKICASRRFGILPVLHTFNPKLAEPVHLTGTEPFGIRRHPIS